MACLSPFQDINLLSVLLVGKINPMLSIARLCVKHQGFILQPIQANTKDKNPIGDFYLFPSENLDNHDGLEDLLALTCKQSSEVMTMRGHLD